MEGLQGLSSHGIRVLLAESGIEPVCNWKPIHLDLVGNDRPGIVRDITRLLAEHGVNLESLSTEVRPAPMSSEPLFHADALLAVPDPVAGHPARATGRPGRRPDGGVGAGRVLKLFRKAGDGPVEKPWVKP